MNYQLDDLQNRLSSGQYQTYTYSYPHKTAYRTLEPAVPLAPIWQAENRKQLMLYIHIPFCEMRCGFCNLFTLANPKTEWESTYLQALFRQMNAIGEVLAPYNFSRFTMGGGTPTYLSPQGLDQLIQQVTKLFGSDLTTIPASVETSPATATLDRLLLLKEWGVRRISMGVQSMFSEENRQIMRYQPQTQLQKALDELRQMSFDCLNLDLIYGIPGQTEQSWLESIRSLLVWQPEELYLYPLYQRPGTGLWQRELVKSRDDRYFQLFTLARDYLVSQGYQQISMRLFRHVRYQTEDSPAYSCQEDGMVGVGCGARSYTSTLHYSDHYDTKRHTIGEIITAYTQRTKEDFQQAYHGIFLSDEDRRRRYLIQSLLLNDGVSLSSYRVRFNGELFTDFSEITQLVDLKLATCSDDILQLNQHGLAYADVIGPWLISPEIANKMQPHIML